MMNDFDSIFSDSSQFQELLIIDPRESKSRKSKFGSKTQNVFNDRDPIYNLSQQIREIKLELLKEEKEVDSKESHSSKKKSKTSEARQRKNAANGDNLLSSRKAKSEERPILPKVHSKRDSFNNEITVSSFISRPEVQKNKVKSSGSKLSHKKVRNKQESLLEKVANKLRLIKDAQDVHDSKIKLLKTPLDTAAHKVKEYNSAGINLIKKSKESNIYKHADPTNDRSNHRKVRVTEQTIPKSTKTEHNTRNRDKSMPRDAGAKKTIIPHDHKRKIDQDMKHHEKSTELNKQISFLNKVENRSRCNFAKDTRIREKISDQSKQLPKKNSDMQRKSSIMKQMEIVEILKVRELSSTTVAVPEKSESTVRGCIAEALDDFDITPKRPPKPDPRQVKIKSIIDYYTPLISNREHKTDEEVPPPKENEKPGSSTVKSRKITDNISSTKIGKTSQNNKEAINSRFETPRQMEGKILNNIFIPTNYGETQKEISHKVTVNPEVSKVINKQETPIQFNKELEDKNIRKAIDKVTLPTQKQASLTTRPSEGMQNTGLQVKFTRDLQPSKEIPEKGAPLADIQGKSSLPKKETEFLDKNVSSKNTQKQEPTTNIKNDIQKSPSPVNKENKSPEEVQTTIKGREPSSERTQRIEASIKRLSEPSKIHSTVAQKSASPTNKSRDSPGKSTNSKGIQKPGSPLKKGREPTQVVINSKLSPRSTSPVNRGGKDSSNNITSSSGVEKPGITTKKRRISPVPDRKQVSPITTQIISKTNEVSQKPQNTGNNQKPEEINKGQKNNTNVKNEVTGQTKVEEQTSQTAQNSCLFSPKIVKLNKLIKEKSPEIIKICNALLNNENVKAHLDEHKQSRMKINQENLSTIPNSTETNVKQTDPSENIKIKLSANLLQSLKKIKEEAIKSGIISSKSKLEDSKDIQAPLNKNLEDQNIKKETSKVEDLKVDKDAPRSKSTQEQVDQKNITKQVTKSEEINIDIKENKFMKANQVNSRSTSPPLPDDQQNIIKQVPKSDENKNNLKEIEKAKSNQISPRTKSPQRQSDQQKFTKLVLKAEEAKIDVQGNKEVKSNHVSRRSKSPQLHSNQQKFAKHISITEAVNVDKKEIEPNQALSRSKSPVLQVEDADKNNIDVKDNSVNTREKTPQPQIMSTQITKPDSARNKSRHPHVNQQLPTKQVTQVEGGNNNQKEIMTHQISPRSKSPHQQTVQPTVNKHHLKPEESNAEHIKPYQSSPRSKSPEHNILKQLIQVDDSNNNKEISPRSKSPHRQTDQPTVNKPHLKSEESNAEHIKSYQSSPRSKSPQHNVLKQLIQVDDSNNNKEIKYVKPNHMSPRSKSPQLQTDQQNVKDLRNTNSIPVASKAKAVKQRVLNAEENNVDLKPRQLSPRSKSPQQQIDQQLTNKDLKDNENQTKTKSRNHSPKVKYRVSPKRTLIASMNEIITKSRSPSPIQKSHSVEPKTNSKISDEIILQTLDYTREVPVENYGSLENVMHILNKCDEDDAELKSKFIEKMKKNDDTLKSTLKKIKSREKETEQLLKRLPKVADNKLTSISKLSAIPLKPETDEKYKELTKRKEDESLKLVILVPSESDLEMQERANLINRISEMESLRNKLVKKLSEKHSTFDMNNEVSRMQQKCHRLQKDNKMLERRLIYLMQQNFEKIDDLRDHLRYLTKQETDIVYSYRDLQAKIPDVSEIQNENNKILKRLTENPVTLDPGVSKQLKDELRTLSNSKICLESDLFKIRRDEIDLKDRLQHKKRIHIIEKAEMETEIKKLESVLRNTKDANKELESKYEEIIKKVKHDSMLEIEKIKKLEACLKDLTERYKRISDEKRDLEKTNALLKEKVIKKHKEAHAQLTAQIHVAKDEKNIGKTKDH